ncbi:hypothetical protein CsatA_010053 [Cannabis sativa]
MEAKYIAAVEAAKDLVWLRKFFTSIGVVPGMEKPLVLLCDNNGAIANSKEPRSHKRSKHIQRKYHIIREYVARGDVLVEKVDTEDNLADPFTKVLAVTAFEKHPAAEAAKELVWLRKFFTSIGVVPGMEKPLVLLCDNNGAIANSKEPRSHKRSKHIERKYHIIREYVARGDVLVEKVDTEDNLADPFTKVLAVTAFEKHRQNLGLIDMY